MNVYTPGTLLTAVAALGLATTAQAEDFDVTGGQTNVLLDTATLSSAASLDLSSVSAEVIAPGDLGMNSVAFPITSSTTFSYDSGLTAFSGAIDHSGSVFFNGDTVEVGDFRIGYDAMRVGGARSGFFVESTTGIAAILFDVENPTALTADDTGLSITANLLVSSEFAGFLLNNGLATADLTGADVGDALVAAGIPAPGAIAGFSLIGLAGLRRRR